jgi:hypothetical protein
LDFRESQGCNKAFSWEIDLRLGRVNFFNNTLEGFSLEVLDNLFFIRILVKVPESSFYFLFLCPDTDLSHSGLLLNILVIIDMVALNILSSQFGIAFGQ